MAFPVKLASRPYPLKYTKKSTFIRVHFQMKVSVLFLKVSGFKYPYPELVYFLHVTLFSGHFHKVFCFIRLHVIWVLLIDFVITNMSFYCKKYQKLLSITRFPFCAHPKPAQLSHPRTVAKSQRTKQMHYATPPTTESVVLGRASGRTRTSRFGRGLLHFRVLLPPKHTIQKVRLKFLGNLCFSVVKYIFFLML